jgi:RHS repeat-associated protein
VVPYTVEEKSYNLKLLQPKGKNRHAIFLKTDAESLLYHYERNIGDPRILHKLVLETDQYGNEIKTAEIAYPRRNATLTEQQKILATYTENNYINKINNNNHLVGVLYQTKQYEIHNLNYTNNKYDAETLKTTLLTCTEIDYAELFIKGLKKRLIQHTRTLFWDETCQNPLSLGAIASHALPYHQQTLELTQTLIEQINGKNEKITKELLDVTCKYLQDGANWYLQSDIQHFAPGNFYLPDTITDPFGNVTTMEYDTYSLFPIKIIDALEFETTAEYDYRVLQAKKLTDPNGNDKELAFDALGMVIKLAICGKNGEGDSLTAPTEIYDYNLHNWNDEQKPVYAYIAKRETHGDPNTRWLETYVYTDGLGNEIMLKTTAEDGLAWILEDKSPSNFEGVDGEAGRGSLIQTTNRWLASGKTIYNNKGNAVKQYEPWYSDTHEFTFEDELTHYGVTPIMYYDPLGRLVITEFPDETTSKVEFDAWQQKNFDQNDCDGSATLTNPSPHYDTPQVIDLDVLARPFQTTDDNGTHGLAITHNKLDITGRILAVTDALGRIATQNVYALSEEHLLFTTNIDSGERWMLNDTVGKPVMKYDSRQHFFLYIYDALQRKTQTNINGAAGECLIYGEDEQENNIGQITEIRAQDGKTSFEYDFKGNIIKQTKQFTIDYQSETNWDEIVNLQNEQFITQTEFNALNYPVKFTHPDDTEICYLYDKGGKLTKILHNQNEYIRKITYNARGQREKIYFGNDTRTKYVYNPLNFRLTQLFTTRKQGNNFSTLQDINYEYDAVGNITKITDYAQETLFFNNTQIEPVTSYQYDALYRLINCKGREFDDQSNTNGNVQFQNVTFPITGQTLRLYNHDYSYDALGNILEDGWKTYEYNTLNNNFLLGHDNAVKQYTYDAHGNLTKAPNLGEILWSSQDRMMSVNSYSDIYSYYNYDLQGERTRKVVVKNNIIEEYYYFCGYELYRKTNNNTLEEERKTISIFDMKITEEEVTDNENKTKKVMRYEIDPYRTIARLETATIVDSNEVIDPDTVVSFQYDNHLGSACLELNENAEIISYEEYYPFGTTSYCAMNGSIEVSMKRYRFCGKERDEETGLYYFGARFYAPWMCRFTAVDPMAHKYPHHSNYVYCANNPLRIIDPDGREEWDLDRQGNLTLRKNGRTDIDIVHATDKAGNNVSSQFVQGTISDFQTVSREYDDGEETRIESIDYIQITNTDAGIRFYEFVADNTSVEWAHIKTSEGSFVGTSHDYEKVTSGYMNIPSTATIFEDSHSHTPKGIIGVSDYQQAFDSTTKKGITYSVYHSEKGTYTRYQPAEGGGMTINKELSKRFDVLKVFLKK